MNIENYHAYVKLLANGTPTTPFSMKTIAPHKADPAYAEQVIEFSSHQHGVPRSVVEAEIKSRYLEL